MKKASLLLLSCISLFALAGCDNVADYPTDNRLENIEYKETLDQYETAKLKLQFEDDLANHVTSFKGNCQLSMFSTYYSLEVKQDGEARLGRYDGAGISTKTGYGWELSRKASTAVTVNDVTVKKEINEKGSLDFKIDKLSSDTVDTVTSELFLSSENGYTYEKNSYDIERNTVESSMPYASIADQVARYTIGLGTLGINNTTGYLRTDGRKELNHSFEKVVFIEGDEGQKDRISYITERTIVRFDENDHFTSLTYNTIQNSNYDEQNNVFFDDMTLVSQLGFSVVAGYDAIKKFGEVPAVHALETPENDGIDFDIYYKIYGTSCDVAMSLEPLAYKVERTGFDLIHVDSIYQFNKSEILKTLYASSSEYISTYACIKAHFGDYVTVMN